MISLEFQIRIVVLSFLFGLFGMFLYSIFNRIFFYKKRKFIRFILEPLFFLLLTVFFYYLNYKVSLGHQTIYIPLFILLGILVYQMFYAKYFLKFIENIAQYFHKKVELIKLDLHKKYDIIKRKIERRKKKNAKKRIRKKKLLESKQGQQHHYDWSFFDCDNDSY